MNENKDILDYDPDSLAVDADEEVFYKPDTDSQVIVTEPDIITIGRKKRREAMREMPEEPESV